MKFSRYESEESHSKKKGKLKGDVKLQPVKLPTFDGDIRNYPRFKADFNKLIAPRMDEVEACSYVLKSCLHKIPCEIVKNLDELEEIWSRLDARYGVPSKLVDIVLDELRSVKPIKDDDDNALIKLVDTVEAAHRDLQMIDIEKEISNSSCMSLIEEKLPRPVKREWSKIVNMNKDLLMNSNKFPQLLDFLINQGKSLNAKPLA